MPEVPEVHGDVGQGSGELLLETAQAHTGGPGLLPQQ